METTIPASFKSLRAALIPAILPIQVVLSVAGGGNVKIFTCFSYNVSVRVQSGDGYHACYFNREKLMERIVWVFIEKLERQRENTEVPQKLQVAAIILIAGGTGEEVGTLSTWKLGVEAVTQVSRRVLLISSQWFSARWRGPRGCGPEAWGDPAQVVLVYLRATVRLVLQVWDKLQIRFNCCDCSKLPRLGWGMRLRWCWWEYPTSISY